MTVDPLGDKLENGNWSKVVYHVEANFNDCHGWRRNGQEHKTVARADLMARHFRARANVRIVKVETIETVVLP